MPPQNAAMLPPAVPAVARAVRRFSSMSSGVNVSPFSKAVVSAMRKLYPESLADKSWDNTGLLLESPFDPIRRQMNSVLLTVDLTKAVADEAIERNDSVVVAYHPIIFRGLKSLTLANSQQQSLLRLAAEGISVYSPHSAVDSAPGGLNDWLADIVTGEPATAPEHQQDGEGDGTGTNNNGADESNGSRSPAKSNASEQPPLKNKPSTASLDDPFALPPPKRPVYMLQHHPSQMSLRDMDLKINAKDHTREIIKPSSDPSIKGSGAGRIVRFAKAQPMQEVIERIGRGLGNPKGFPIAVPQGKAIEDIMISSVGICAGSGGSLLNGLDVDMLFTGELSHHEALAAIEKGQVVVTLFHSNSERGFLHSVMRQQLLDKVKGEWEVIRKEERERLKRERHLDEHLKEALEDDFVGVEVSERDRDPYGIVVLRTDI